jgi:hypothetical protein
MQSTKKSIDIESFLPERIMLPLRNEGDRFGFSYLVANRTKMKQTPIVRCSWVHGWHWYPLKLNDILKGSMEYIKRSNVVVATQHQSTDLNKYIPNTNIVVGGLPYTYVPNPTLPRKKDAVIALLPKSLKENDEHLGARRFVDFLNKNRFKYNNPTICIFGGDADRIDLVKYVIDSDFNYIIGADPSDINSLLRMKVIFSFYEYAIGPTIGSYIPYAHSIGCKAAIVGEFVNVSNIKNSKYLNYDYINKKFPFLFCDDLDDFNLYVDWANDEIGSLNTLPLWKVKEIFGWGFIGSLSHYNRAILSRFL